jgi:hypothetical protein
MGIMPRATLVYHPTHNQYGYHPKKTCMGTILEAIHMPTTLNIILECIIHCWTHLVIIHNLALMGIT